MSDPTFRKHIRGVPLCYLLLCPVQQQENLLVRFEQPIDVQTIILDNNRRNLSRDFPFFGTR